MEFKEVLRFADEKVFAKTGKHLDDLQEAILKEALQGRKYAKIAQERDCTEGYVRVTAAELWKILSEVLGEDVSKVNVRSILERAKFYNSYSSAIDKNYGIVNNHLNICSKKTRSSTKNKDSPDPINQPHLDLGDAPEIFSFYDRANELATLEHWLIEDHCHLIQILGISGIGKTSLAIRLIDRIQSHFDTIIYRSLRFSPTLETTLTNLLQIFSQSTENYQEIRDKNGRIDSTEILNYLRQKRCLIILDDVQTLFSSNELAGQYKLGYEDYHPFFKLISEVSHPSSFILISSEKSREILLLEKENCPGRSLILGSLGIASKAILQDYQLSDEDDWETLIHTYQGNPLWLNLTATLIRDFFGGRVREFLEYDQLILDELLQGRLQQILGRLTEAEMGVINRLVEETEPLTVSQILHKLNSSPSDLMNVIKSLTRRFLVEKIEKEKTTFFVVNPVIKASLKNADKPSILIP